MSRGAKFQQKKFDKRLINISKPVDESRLRRPTTTHAQSDPNHLSSPTPHLVLQMRDEVSQYRGLIEDAVNLSQEREIPARRRTAQSAVGAQGFNATMSG